MTHATTKTLAIALAVLVLAAGLGVAAIGRGRAAPPGPASSMSHRPIVPLRAALPDATVVLRGSGLSTQTGQTSGSTR